MKLWRENFKFSCASTAVNSKIHTIMAKLGNTRHKKKIMRLVLQTKAVEWVHIHF